MELSYDEAEKMLWVRLREHPEVESLVTNSAFRQSLDVILKEENIDVDFLPLLEGQVLITLAFYSPLSSLVKNISAITELPAEKATKIVTKIEERVLLSVHDELLAFDYLWNEELKKGSEQSVSTSGQTPQASPLGEPRPLTREELMQKLSPRRTMVEDVASVQHPQPSQTPSTPVRGYEAYQNSKGPGTGR